MIAVLLTLIIVGVCLYFVQTYIPMAKPIKTLITVVVVIVICLWLLHVFGVADLPIPSLR